MARIPDEVIERLKREVDLGELIARSGVSLLRKQGRDLVGRCPFHDDDTPSLVVSPAKGLWHCLGACQAGGSVIDWVMKVEGVSFRHAVELLRGGETPRLRPGRPVRTSTTRKLPSPLEAGADDQQLLASVVSFYAETLDGSPEAGAYLARRKIDDPAAVRRFRLGYANRTLAYRLPQANRKAGAELRGRLQRLGIIRESGHEHFTGSLVVPVITPAGAVAECYGRKIRDDLRPGTPLHLYLPGPHRGVWNEEALVGGEVIVCESLIDALSFYCAGFQNVTATYGTGGFTADHAAAFERHGVARVLIAFDRDDAGERAAATLAERLLAQGVECFRVVFPSGADANDVASAAANPRDALGRLVRHALWMGKGKTRTRHRVGPVEDRVTTPAEAPPEVCGEDRGEDPTDDGEDRGEDGTAAGEDDPSEPPELLPPAAAVAPPVSLVAPVLAAVGEVSGDELSLHLGRRRWRVRGLARLRPGESLKANVAVRDDAGALHVDTVDLYSSRSRAAFVRDTTAELGADEQAIKREVGQLLLALEEHLLQRDAEDEAACPEMTEAERTEALELLRSPDLTGRIVADFGRLGVVGEETNALLCYLAVVSRKCERPLGVLLQSSSAAGKSTLAEAALSFCPEEEKVAFSALTGQSLYYLGEADLAHKVLAVAEEEGAERATYALKLLQSEGRLSIASAGKDPVTGKLVTHTYAVKGPVALLTTTTAAQVDEELANRLVSLAVAEDAVQTGAIHAAQRRALTVEGLLARSERDGVVRLHHNAQRLLAALPVVVPGAEQLSFPHRGLRSRRDHAKYLGMICASALLHQHQRPRRTLQAAGRQVAYVEATKADVELADRLAAELFTPAEELAPATRRVLDALSAWAPSRPFTRRQAREALGLGDTQLKVHLARLVDLEYVVVKKTPSGFAYDLTEADRSDFSARRSGPGRVPVAGRSDPGRGVDDEGFDQLASEEEVAAVGFSPRRGSGERPLVVVTRAD